MKAGPLLAVALFVVAANVPAQQSETPALNYWLDQQTKQRLDGTKLQAELDELRRQLAADPNKPLHDEIEEGQDLASEVRRVRGRADKFVPPYLVRTLDLVLRSVEDQVAQKRLELTTKERSMASDRAGLLRQLEAIQQDIANNTQVEDAINQRIQDLRDERIQASKSAELEALEHAAVGGNPPSPPPSAITTKTTKGKK